MKPHKISFVNAITLISFGLWGYVDVDYSPTALIPVVFGVIILALNSGLKKENKTVINISEYSNLWADHKRSKFEQISFEKKDGVLLPTKINIHFDGRVFKLEQN